MSATSPDSHLPAHWVDQSPALASPPPRGGFARNLHAFASVQFATAAGAPPEARLNWAVAQVSAMIAATPGRGAFVYRLSVFVMAWVAPLLIFRLPTFQRLGFEQRVHALERFERSPFGMMLFAIKALICIVYYEHPDAAVEVGFDGACMGAPPEEVR